jgi:hypothetical protein
MLLGLGLLKLLGVMVRGSIRPIARQWQFTKLIGIKDLCGEKPIFPRAVGQPDAS